MNLDGWDTCSIVSVDLVNQALARAGDRTIRTFSYTEDDLEISGSFGAWALAPGGSLRLVSVKMPIASGVIRARGEGETDISGIVLTAQMKLGLIGGDTPDTRNLAFDTSLGEGEGGAEPIKIVEIDDPSGRLARFDLDMVKEALTACLSKHAADASFVFASVDARSTAQAAGLACPGNDWGFVDPGDGRHYLAILGSLDAKRPDGPIRIGPELITPAAPAYFAVSQRLFILRALLPILQSSFRPRTSFAIKGDAVVSTKAIGLGHKKVALFEVAPVLRQVSIKPVKGALAVHAAAHADLPLSTRLDLTVDMKLPFHHDPKTGSMSFKPGKPVVRHKLNKSGIIGNTLGLIIELIVALARDPILKSVAQIANGMQAVNNPTTKPVVWNGVRDFHAAQARWDNGLWLADTRAVEPPAPAPADREKTNEPA